VRDVDGAAEDHAQERDGAAVLGEDHLPRGIELDLRLGDDLAELLGGESVERRPLGEEARDLAQPGFQLDLLVAVRPLVLIL
jgi:hypothetical protein